MPRVERLGHGAEIVAQASPLSRCYAQGVGGLLGVEAAQSGARRRAAERAAGARRMKSIVVMAGIDRLRNFRFDLHTEVIREHEILAGALAELTDRERGSERSDRWMGQQAVHTIFGHGKLGIVEIVGVNGNAIRESGKPRRRLHARSYNGGFAAHSKALQVLADQRRHHRCRAGQRQAEAVQDRLPTQLQHVGRNIAIFRVYDELGDIFGQPRRLGERRALRSSRRCGEPLVPGCQRGHGQRTLDEISADHCDTPPVCVQLRTLTL